MNKQIKVLEHRLHRALVKFNEAIAANKDLREEIDNLRRERVVFDGIYKKLQLELSERNQVLTLTLSLSLPPTQEEEDGRDHRGRERGL